MKENGEKLHKQKQLLLVNLRELYVEYGKKYPADKAGFSKLCLETQMVHSSYCRRHAFCMCL